MGSLGLEWIWRGPPNGGATQEDVRIMKTIRVAWVLGSILCVAILLNGCGNPDKNKLMFKPEVNAARTVNVSNASNSSMSLMGMSMTIGYTDQKTYIMTPTAVSDTGDVTLTVTYDFVKAEMTGMDAMMGGAGMPNMPGMDDMFGMKAMQKALDTLKGQSFTVQVSKLGEVLRVEGADAIAEKVADAYEGPAHLPGAEMKSSIRDGYGDASMQEQMKRIFLKVPDKALNAGDSWEENLSTENMEVPVDITSTLTVGERNAGVLPFTIANQMSVDFSKGPMGKALASGNASATLTGQGSGTAEFEEATGWVRSYVTTGKASGNISAPGGMSIPIEISTKTEITSFPKS